MLKYPFVLAEQEFNELLNEASAMYGEISLEYLHRCMDVVYTALTKYPRVCAIRIDMRFPYTNWGGDPDMVTCFPRIDPSVITRFMASLKSQLKADHTAKGRRGEPAYPLYIWVRERNDSPHPHYHVALLFNKDVYAFLGDPSNPDARNMATRIQKAWCSALDLAFPAYASLVHVPGNAVYSFERKSAVIYSQAYRLFLLRMAYLCKTRTKSIGDGYRHFGTSQKKGIE